MKSDLSKVAQQIVSVSGDHTNSEDVLQISSELISQETKMIVLHDEEIIFSSISEMNNNITPQFIKSDPELKKVFTDTDIIRREIKLPAIGTSKEKVSAIVVGMPIYIEW